MFPDVRLMIVALLASVVGISCGLGALAAFRINHEPFTRLQSSEPPLRLAVDSAPSMPLSYAAPDPAPFGVRFPINMPLPVPVTTPAAADRPSQMTTAASEAVMAPLGDTTAATAAAEAADVVASAPAVGSGSDKDSNHATGKESVVDKDAAKAAGDDAAKPSGDSASKEASRDPAPEIKPETTRSMAPAAESDSKTESGSSKTESGSKVEPDTNPDSTGSVAVVAPPEPSSAAVQPAPEAKPTFEAKPTIEATSVPEAKPTPEAKPAPPETTPAAADAAATASVSPEAKPDVKPALKDETKSEPKTQSKSESKSESKAAAKPAHKAVRRRIVRWRRVRKPVATNATQNPGLNYTPTVSSYQPAFQSGQPYQLFLQPPAPQPVKRRVVKRLHPVKKPVPSPAAATQQIPVANTAGSAFIGGVGE